MTDTLSLAVHAFASRVLMYFSVDETIYKMKFPTNTQAKRILSRPVTEIEKKEGVR